MSASMVLQYKGHRDAVAKWMSQAGPGLSNDELVDLLDQALRALWAVARPHISEVTLAAVLDRALVNVSDAFPSVPRLTVDADAANLAALRTAAPRLKRETLAQAVEYVLTDFLAILGNLTAEMFSKSLLAKLSGLRLKRRRANPGDRKKP